MPRVRLPLTFEMTRGTKTYYLPAQRGPQAPPIITLMLRRRPNPEAEQGTSFVYSAGMAICSAYERFERKEGRSRAFERLRWAKYRGVEATDPLDLLRPLMLQVRVAIKASPINLTILDTRDELLGILEKASEVFNVLDKNRSAIATVSVQECCLHGTCDFEVPPGDALNPMTYDDPTGC